MAHYSLAGLSSLDSPGPLAGMEYVRQRGEEGRQRGINSQLSRLAAQAYTAPAQDRQAIFGQMAQYDPSAAMEAEGAFAKRDDDALTNLTNRARMFVGFAKGGNEAVVAPMYGELARQAQSLGFNVPASYDPSFLPGIEQLASYGQDAPEQFTLAPGSKRFDAAGNVIAEVGFAPANAQYVDVPTGDGGSMKMLFNPKTRQFEQPNFGGSVDPVIQPVGGGGIFASLLSGVPGLRVTSTTRTPDQNRDAGGVDNSYHLTGQAIDIGTPDPQQRQAIAQWADANGFEVIDNYQDGHVHLEPRPGGARPAAGQLGRTPPKATEAAVQLSPEEVAGLGLPSGTVAQRKPDGSVSILHKPDARDGTGGVLPLSAGEAAKVRTQFKETKDALNTFKAFDTALGAIQGAKLLTDGAAKGRLGTAYNNARAALRILYNTGVLQPGELPMLESALRDPTRFTAILDPRTRPQIQSQLDELYRTVERSIDNQVTSYPQLFNQQVYQSEKARRTGGQQGGYQQGQVIEANGKRYRVTGGDPSDPDVEEL